MPNNFMNYMHVLYGFKLHQLLFDLESRSVLLAKLAPFFLFFSNIKRKKNSFLRVELCTLHDYIII